MDDTDLERLLADLESDRVERKESLSDGDKIRQAICAFANDLPNHQKPGVVFIGVSDKGDCVRLRITDQLLQTLGGMKSDGNISPFPSLIVQKRTVNGCELAVVIVHPSDAPPVHFKGTPWIRVGPRRSIATPEEVRRLAEKRKSKDLPFDLHAITSASLEDLDLGFFGRDYLPATLSREVLEQNERSIEDQLLALRFVATQSQTLFPTLLGLLVAGYSPAQAIPCAYIQFLRLDGNEITDPIKSQAEIHGHLSALFIHIDELLKANISTAADVASGSTEVRFPDYPIVALQQLVRNAVMHRTYEATNAPVRITWFNDRIEIQNPGGPFGLVTRENFGTGVTDYRNPHLAVAMKDLGYVQRFGLGIALARKELGRNGNPLLEYTIEDGFVLAIVRRRP